MSKDADHYGPIPPVNDDHPDNDLSDEDVGFAVYAHGYNGDCSFTEIWAVVGTLARAKKVAMDVMVKDRYENLHDGKPTITWMEVFGPGIGESLGLELIEGRLTWVGA